MLVAGCEPPCTSTPCTSSSSPHQDYPYPVVSPPPPPQPQQQQLDLALEGRSISLQQRAPSHPGTPHPSSAHPSAASSPAPHAETKTFSPLQLQLRIDLHSEQGVDVLSSSRSPNKDAPATPLTRRQRAQLRRRQEQQKPADQVVYQRPGRTPSRPRTPGQPPSARRPLAMSTMSMPAAGQKFAADDAASTVFGSAEETSAAVKRLLAKSGSSVVEEHHRVTSSSTKTSSASIDYLQDSFDFLHQRHMKNLSDVIARHQQRQQQAPGQAPGQDEPQPIGGLTGLSQSTSQRHKKQVHIHQSAFYDGQSELGELGDNMGTTFKSTKTINLSNNNVSGSNNSSCDLDDAKVLQQQQQVQQQRRCVRENSTSSLQSQSSLSSNHSNSFDNFNNNFCDAVTVSNKSNSTKVSSKSSSTTSSTTSSSTRVQQSFSSKKQVIKQSFSSSSQDFEDRMGIDVMLTPSAGAPGTPSTPGTPTSGTIALASQQPADLAATAMATAMTKKVKQTTKVTSSMTSSSSGTDQPEECKQSVKAFKSKTVKKSVSDGRHVHTDVDKFSETAEEEKEGTSDKPVITFSHVSSEGSHQAFTNDIVRFDSSALSSPSRSRSPSPLLEMPAPYQDLSKEIKRPPMEKA